MVEPEWPQTIWRMRVTGWISKATRIQAQARAPRAPTTTHSRTHPRARACTHMQKYTILIAFTRQ